MPSITLTVSTLCLVFPQEPAGATKPAPPPAASPTSADVGKLKERIRGMRTNLLLGGDAVRHAEAEAADFYKSKIEGVNQQLDATRAELSEKRASYDLAIDRTLKAGDDRERVFAMREASTLRTAIKSLEQEAKTFQQQRANLRHMVSGVAAREREREKLAAQLEAVSEPGGLAGLAMSSVGLAPEAEAKAPASYLDEALVSDLLARDPGRARSVLFATDPAGYWTRFPLRPPADALREALGFPKPDLPGQR